MHTLKESLVRRVREGEEEYVRQRRQSTATLGWKGIHGYKTVGTEQRKLEKWRLRKPVLFIHARRKERWRFHCAIPFHNDRRPRVLKSVRLIGVGWRQLFIANGRWLVSSQDFHQRSVYPSRTKNKWPQRPSKVAILVNRRSSGKPLVESWLVCSCLGENNWKYW